MIFINLLPKKRCAHCKFLKPISYFQNNKPGKYGKYSVCRACKCDYSTNQYIKNRTRRTEQSKALILANPDKRKSSLLMRLYGITIEQKREMLAAQGGVCGACSAPTPGDEQDKWNVDHDHVTKKVRGILCGNCNRALGLLQDDPKNVQGLLNYILKFSI